jgi:hypothetical protein
LQLRSCISILDIVEYRSQMLVRVALWSQRHVKSWCCGLNHGRRPLFKTLDQLSFTCVYRKGIEKMNNSESIVLDLDRYIHEAKNKHEIFLCTLLVKSYVLIFAFYVNHNICLRFFFIYYLNNEIWTKFKDKKCSYKYMCL